MSDAPHEPSEPEPEPEPHKYTASLDGWRDANAKFTAAIANAMSFAESGEHDLAMAWASIATAHATKAGLIENAIEINMARRYGIGAKGGA
jgi:hypothetical protein